MPKDKDRTVNPAAAARKAEKARAIKKGKAAVTQQRNERLSQMNPARIERQLADLHARQTSQGGLPSRERRQIEELERDLERIRKARAATGIGSTNSGSKRTREQRDGREHHDRKRPQRSGADGTQIHQSESEDTDDSVRRIPMPRDTPPPVPTRRRQARYDRGTDERATGGSMGPSAAPPVEVQTVYEAKPQLRNLQREAVSFVPAVVRQKIQAAKGQGGRLLEEDELEVLEKQGYGIRVDTNGATMAEAATAIAAEMCTTAVNSKLGMQVEMEEVADEDI